MAKDQTRGFIRSAKVERTAGIKNIMARLAVGYMKPGGHQNKQYEEADRRMLELYLNNIDITKQTAKDHSS